MGQLLRQGGRAAAIYFSDVLLWLSFASFLEVLLVLVAGTLCILTAGFLFESMKKNPLVLVLGSALALTGTFLVFREVRSLVWPPAPAVAEKGSGKHTPLLPSDLSPPKTVTPPAHTPTPSLLPSDLGHTPCPERSRSSCQTSSSCYWSVLANRCAPKPNGTSLITPELASCHALSTKSTCALSTTCYWSKLTNHCERLRLGSGLVKEPNPLLPSKTSRSCTGKLLLGCVSTPGCQWSSKLKACTAAP